MKEVFYVLAGLAPSLAWLLFYLKKDLHPEPKRKILTVFLAGALGAGLGGGLETLFFKRTSLSYRGLGEAGLTFFTVALIEEVAKYLPFKIQVLGHEILDEPIDVPEYLIASALGFAAAENIFLFFTKQLKFLETFFVSSFRFIGATLLHAVCSGLLGYFLALSFFHEKKGRGSKARLLKAAGFGGALLLHTLYNFSIIKASKVLKIALPLILLGGTGLLLSSGLARLGKLKGVCRD